MTMLANPQGCKVGWAYYDNEAEATERAKAEADRRERQLARGYDFGYQWPGSVEHIAEHPEYGECWKVVTT
jgi:hypothetical protein